MRLFIPNFTFEDDLAQRKTARSPATQLAVDELAPVMGLLASAGDAVLTTAGPEPSELPDSLKQIRFVTDLSGDERPSQVIPFGWTDETRQLAVQAGMRPDEIPPHDAVCHVNSRAFNAVHDVVLCDEQVALPFGDSFGKLCRDMAEWKAAVLLISETGFEKWVAKPAISHAGRNRLLAQGTQLNSQQSGWLRKQFVEAGYVYVEPWVIPEEEWGLQFEIAGGSANNVSFLGATQLVNDAVGRYLGSQISHSAVLCADVDRAVQHGLNVCRSAEPIGYFGPIGIDCFRFALPSGHKALRLCNDINARFTMGRIALQLKTLLNPDEFAFWGQFRAVNFFDNLPDCRNSSAPAYIDDVRVILTSPRALRGRAVRTVTALLAHTSRVTIQQFRNQLMQNRS